LLLVLSALQERNALQALVEVFVLPEVHVRQIPVVPQLEFVLEREPAYLEEVAHHMEPLRRGGLAHLLALVV
jgi:hypothetical protein